jgi:FKBP-type peptidyl-prolyl cis-trans isomerase SlpA
MTHEPPRIQAASFLTLHYRLAGPAGDVINTFAGKPATLSLGTGELSPEVERCLLGLEEGAHRTFDLPAGAAFGPRNPDMQQWVANSLLRQMGDPQERYAPGDVVQFPTPDGQSSYAGAVVAVKAASGAEGTQPDGAVLFDFNHPLAGQPVSFEVKVIAVL